MRYLLGEDNMHVHGVTKVEVQGKRIRPDVELMTVVIKRIGGPSLAIDCFGVRSDGKQSIPSFEVVEDWEEDSKTL